DLAADHADAVEQVAAFAGIDEADQAVADFQLEGVEVEQFFNFLWLFPGGFFAFFHRGRGHNLLFILSKNPGEAAAGCAEGDEGNFRKRGEGHEGEEDAGDDQGFGFGEELGDHIFAEVAAAGGAGDDQAGGQGDDEGGDLRDQAIADGELGVELETFHQVPAALEFTDI